MINSVRLGMSFSTSLQASDLMSASRLFPEEFDAGVQADVGTADPTRSASVRVSGNKEYFFICC